MTIDNPSILSYLHPYDVLTDVTRAQILDQCEQIDVAKGRDIYVIGDQLRGLYIIESGQVAVTDENAAPISLLRRENSFGERGLLRDGRAATNAKAQEDCRLLVIPSTLFQGLLVDCEPFGRFYRRSGNAKLQVASKPGDLTRVRVDALMSTNPVVCAEDTPIQDAARMMRDKKISSLCVVDGDALRGIVTLRDFVNKAVVDDLPMTTPIAAIMTNNPRVLTPAAIGSDVLHLMMENRLGHLPVISAGRLVGIVTQTDLTRYQASHASTFVAEAAQATTVQELAAITARIPKLLVSLVATGNRHDVVTRLITDIADVVTRRLLRMAEDKFGTPPARYLWLACGSQGRQEQTGVSDQDNCLILEDGISDADAAYFAPFAQFVSDGLDACGYVYCPGDMMATNPRWCQPLSVWTAYFKGWIANPSKEAQMLASVMFDLRPIGGDETLFADLQAETLRLAASNSIFTAHMATNALTHATPLGLLRGLSTIRAGEHRDTIDMKLNGVIPVVDLGRMYALAGQLSALNTRARLKAALDGGIISNSGGLDLVAAYDLVAQTRLQHQANLIKQDLAPDNFLPPATLSGFERSHLRDAFVVIKTMQSALMQGRGVLA
ncbi:CBS domain-containing protein [Loktanella ponticola]|uniref:CBS domain-containing protein n=1 Tax=Yoonia ponticola TaxID=1524255 RepID=A0A7W9BJU7_9RHOB|nr:CBS domain-containing protein [Yoonia ponticola]